LPEIIKSGRIIGQVNSDLAKRFNLNEKLILISGTTDSNASLIAANLRKEDGLTVLGTTIVVKKIINNLNYDAAFNIQLRLKNGVPMIFEINPRFSSTVYARHLMGFPDLAEWISYRLEKKKKFKI